MRMKMSVLAASVAVALNATAGTMGAVEEAHPWSVLGSLGYTWFNDAYSGGALADPTAQTAIGDGQTVVGRFAIARDVYAYDFEGFKTVHFGLELGVQNGNTIRLGIPQANLDIVGGLPVQSTIKPMMDLLGTLTLQPMDEYPAFGVVKLGVAYRRMQINDRVTFNDLSEAAFEVQGGLGYKISDRADLSLSYQGIFNGSTNYTINSTTFTGHVSNIPNQNGLLLTLAYAV
ncbi:MAG: hypothetical protein B7X00_01405 [Legionella sp. 21-45-4]|nr:MAG: hypothetical protein B7X00_01405 [Legionella sp. 21-45-4]